MDLVMDFGNIDFRIRKTNYMNYYALPGVRLDEDLVKIFNAIKDETGFSYAEILVHSRRSPVATARHITAFMIRKHLNYGFVKTGNVMGRDHTSIMHSCKNVTDLLQVDDNLRATFERIDKRIAGEQITPEPVKEKTVKANRITKKKVKAIAKPVDDDFDEVKQPFVRVKGEYSNMRLYDLY